MADSTAQYVTAVSTALNNVPQQIQSKIQGAIKYQGNWTDPGTAFYLDNRGKTNPKEAQTKGSAIMPRELQGFRRGGYFQADEDYFHIFEEDKVRELLDPTSTDMMSLMAGKEREKDRDIIAGLIGNVNSSSGNQANAPLDTVSALPSSQQIALSDNKYLHFEEKSKVATSGNLHLTVGKLIYGRTILKPSYVGGNLYLLVDEFAKAALLAATPTTSQWYAEVKALVNGDTDNFMGFTFIEVFSGDEDGAFLPNYQSGGDNCTTLIAFYDEAFHYRERMISNVTVSKRFDWTGQPTQVYYKRERAWCRRYDKGVLKIEVAQPMKLQ